MMALVTALLRPLLPYLAGLALLALVWAYDRLIDDPNVFSDGHEAGVMQERQVWETARNRLIQQQAAERRQAQAKIDAAETRYLDHRTGDALKIASLEQALQEAKKNVQNSVCAGAPAIPGGVSKHLNAIGR
jgi:LmbE family N-acetylglucosaminyl deacetylase